MEQKQIDFQEKCKKFWEYQKSICQTDLIDHLFDYEVEGFEWKNVANETYEDEHGELVENEVLEWWEINHYLAQELELLGEPILRNRFGIWWGRTTSGQAVYLDAVIEKLVVLNKI